MSATWRHRPKWQTELGHRRRICAWCEVDWPCPDEAKRRQLSATVPGEVLVGEWAHIRYHQRQHLIQAVDPQADAAEPVLFACGRRTWTAAVWHGPELPHLPHCQQCERAAEGGGAMTADQRRVLRSLEGGPLLDAALLLVLRGLIDGNLRTVISECEELGWIHRRRFTTGGRSGSPRPWMLTPLGTSALTGWEQERWA